MAVPRRDPDLACLGRPSTAKTAACALRLGSGRRGRPDRIRIIRWLGVSRYRPRPADARALGGTCTHRRGRSGVDSIHSPRLLWICCRDWCPRQREGTMHARPTIQDGVQAEEPRATERKLEGGGGGSSFLRIDRTPAVVSAVARPSSRSGCKPRIHACGGSGERAHLRSWGANGFPRRASWVTGSRFLSPLVHFAPSHPAGPCFPRRAASD